jgi:RNA polymerase sigma-70 factor (ECF subfamily)
MILEQDQQLARQARQGDQEAFGQIVRQHQVSVFNTAYRMLGNRQEAEDAAQEAFIRALRFIESFDPDKPIGPWLRRITVNVCLNRLQSLRPEPSLDDNLPAPPHPAPGPEQYAIRHELGQHVRSELLNLSPRYRAVIELRHFQELSYTEIAEALQRPLSDIKSDLFRARRLLAERLQDLQPERS